MLLGAVLLAAETLVPGTSYAFFFGVAAIAVGALVGLGIGGPAWLQWLLFSAASVASLLALRGPLLRRFRGRPSDVGTVGFVGETAVLLDDLAPGAVGKAELRGTSWSARSREARPLPRGQRCRVERVEGLTLWLRPEQ